jgi:hypothetical protein
MRRRVRLLRIERMPAVIGLTAVIFAAWALAAAVVVPSSNLDHIGNLPGPPPQMVVTTQAADPGSSVATSDPSSSLSTPPTSDPVGSSIVAPSSIPDTSAPPSATAP